jgi:hypothetical protein
MSQSKKRPPGQLRRSQVITTFGPGSLIDLPDHSAIIGGLDHWLSVNEEIHEPRLIEKLKRLLNLPTLKLFAPPPDDDDPGAPQTGITAWQFPEWFTTQDVIQTSPDGARRSRRLLHRNSLTKGKYINEDRKKEPVVPVRFVRACRRGHISDIQWHRFVHAINPNCKRLLFMDERGTSGDLSEIFIRCECGEQRSLIEAKRGKGALGPCPGLRPWLGGSSGEDCSEESRLLVRHASNAYFPQVMSVISLPDRDESLERAVNQIWETYLQYVDSLEELQRERSKKPPIRNVLEGYSDEEVLAEIEIRKGERPTSTTKSVKQAEFEVLANTKDTSGSDTHDSDFYAQSLSRKEWAGKCTESIEKVVLVHRLREVVAQVGFTRFEAISPDTDGELKIEVLTAPLAREVRWLPAMENRGEGVFIQFKREAIEKWRNQLNVQRREEQLRLGFDAWQQLHPYNVTEFRGITHYLLHSISHLLLTAVSLECGYPASSIRERVYSSDAGYGILLYTGTPDAEGTLGGLIEAGRGIKKHLQNALELGRLCSNDPVCAQHDPQNSHEIRYLQGAACHGCLYIAETSCESHNNYLDRSLVIPTVEMLGVEFFVGEFE